MENKNDRCGPQGEILHVSTLEAQACTGRLCPHGKCRKDGFVLIDATPQDVEAIKDENILTEKVWKEVSPKKMSYKEEEMIPALAIERARTLLHEDSSRFADNINRYNYNTTEDYGKTIESTINVQKFRDGRIKKTTQQAVTEFYPPVCGIHAKSKRDCPKSKRCDPNADD